MNKYFINLAILSVDLLYIGLAPDMLGISDINILVDLELLWLYESGVFPGFILFKFFQELRFFGRKFPEPTISNCFTGNLFFRNCG